VVFVYKSGTDLSYARYNVEYKLGDGLYFAMRAFRTRTKFLISISFLITAGALYGLWTIFADTTLGVTLRSNFALQQGLVLHYTFDAREIDYGQSNEVRDSSNEANHGNWANHSTTTGIGRVGQAMSFSGYDDHVSVADDATLDFGASDDFTIALWFKAAASTTAIAGSYSTTTDTFSTSGYHRWTAPSETSYAEVACWGAGGAGGDGGNRGGGGGGGGAYAASGISVTGGSTYTIYVGAGGAGPTTENANGGDGEDSTFATTTVVAAGGTGGTGGSSGATQAGGAGGTTAASTGDTEYAGGTGGDGYNTDDVSGGGGGAGGPAGAGNAGSNGGVPTATSGGDGGSGDAGGGGAGGAGVAGVYVEFTDNGADDADGGGGGGGGDDGTRGGDGGAPGGGGGGGEANATAGVGDGADGQCTVAYSVYNDPTSTSSVATSTLVSKADTAGGYKLYIDGTGNLCFAIDDDATWGPDDVICTTGVNYYTTGEYHHVIAQKDGTSGIYLYVDNPSNAATSSTSLVATSDLSNSAALHIGNDVQGTYDTYTGHIDDVRVWSKVLSNGLRNRLHDLGNTTRFAQTVSQGATEDGLTVHYTMDARDVTTLGIRNVQPVSPVAGGNPFASTSIGAESIDAENADSVIAGTLDDDRFSRTVAAAGDVNGDGYKDLFVSTLDYGNTGFAHLFYGSVHGPPLTAENADVVFTTSATDDNFSSFLAGAGDVNGDGYDDLLVGAEWADVGGDPAGHAYLLYGGSFPSDVNADNADVVLSGTAHSDYFGDHVAGVGDVNNDGYDDFVVGAANATDAGTSRGRAYLFYGGSLSGGIDAADADVIFNGEEDNDAFGGNVAAAGDVNNDGYDDIIFGAAQADDTGSGRGRAYLFYGGSLSASVDVEDADVIFDGTTDSDEFGYDAAGVGDVNNDGFDDVLVGAWKAEDTGDRKGQAYLFYGGSLATSTLASDADVTINGTDDLDFLGRQVDGAGDVNADGYDDLLIGAYYAADTGSTRGRAYLLYGGSLSATENAEDADVIFNGASDGDFFGMSLAGVGDTNADGYDDLLIGAQNADEAGTDRGLAYVFLPKNTTYGYASGTETTLGRLGQALAFDGMGDSVEVGNVATSTGTTTSVAFWVKADDTTSRPILQLNDLAAIELDATGNATTTGSGWNTTTIYVDASTASPAVGTDWHHITVVDSVGIQATNTIIGFVSDSYFDGSLDDVRFYSKALTQADVERLAGLGNTTRIFSTVSNETNGPVAHYTFDGPHMDLGASTAEIEDTSGNNFHADWQNHATTTVIGVHGQAITFGPGSDIVVESDKALLDITGELTLSAWIRRNSIQAAGSADVIISKGAGVIPEINYQLVSFGVGGTSEAVAFKFYNDSIQSMYSSSGNVTDTTDWHHFAATYDDTNNDIVLYIDGVARSETVLSGAPETASILTNNRDLSIGADSSGNWDFNGSIDDVRVYDRVLSPAEIKRMYDLGR